MALLNRTLIAKTSRPVKVLFFGFTPRLCAGAGRMVQLWNDDCGFNGSVAAAGDLSQGAGAALYRQDGRYTIRFNGVRENTEEPATKIISCLDRFYDPQDNYADFMLASHNPHLKMVFSDTGTDGIKYDPEDKDPYSANTYPRLLMDFLRRRYEFFGGDLNKGLDVFPFEQTEDNGTVLRTFVLRYARDMECPEAFISWLEKAVRFYDCALAVRVRPASNKAVREFAARRGYTDHCLIDASFDNVLLVKGNEVLKDRLPQHPQVKIEMTDHLPPQSGIDQLTRIDMHCDTLTREEFSGPAGSEDLYRLEGHLDLSRLKKSGALIQDLAVFLCELYDKDMEKVYAEFLRIRELLRKNEEKYADVFSLITDRSSLEECVRTRKLGALLSVEDGAMINGKMERLQEMYDKGVRLITLTWNFENCIGYPNSKDPEIMEKKGLKEFGFEVIRKMNELGMIIDVSHLNDAGFWDVLKTSSKPVMASHSNARALTNVPRNMTDEMIAALAEKGGVMGMNFCPAFLSKNEQVMKVKDLVAHIKHIREVGGIDVIALGSDFDGIPGSLEIADCSQYGKLEKALRAEGFTDEELEKIFYRNALRVIRENLK